MRTRGIRALHHDAPGMVDLSHVTLTEALAIWGAFTGSIGAVTGGVVLVDRLRERPSLVLLSHVTILGHEHELELTAINQGRRPALLVDAGIAIGVEAVSIGRFRRKRPRLDGVWGSPEPGVLPKTLAPWEAMRWTVRYAHKHPPSAVSIAFVQDSDGRYAWESQVVAKPSRGVRQIASR